MNNLFDPKEQIGAAKARESFSGRMLTNRQFDDAMAITGILEREIKATGKFKEKLSDYAVAMARTEKFDVMKSETIIRDLYKARTGETMNQTREKLMEREASLTKDQKHGAYKHAKEVGQMIEHGNKMSFHRAYAHVASDFANELGITDVAAKTLMKEALKSVEDKDLYEWGKEQEEKFYRPQIEAEKQQRKTLKVENGRTQTRQHQRA
ncbi:MAG TPA: hypothetical protein ENK06_03560 [Gammaproteobacteria bacterium]|nr:hypothetical protein [Gammaproteobacteria bacterium]